MNIDLITEFLSLPQWVEFEGVHFQPKLLASGSEARLCYEILFASEDSKHFADIEEHGCFNNTIYKPGGGACGFLYLCEGIQDERGLLAAIFECKAFLQEHNLLT